MALILSIQSHVTYGYVGNRVATFTLQRLMHDVITVNTVQFSNHTGYGEWEGDIFSVEHLTALWAGIKKRIDPSQVAALLTGYLGNETLAEFIQQVKSELQTSNPNLIYCLDPVFGDVGRNLFVRKELADFYRDDFIGQGTVITPNHFEFNYLTQSDNQSLAQLKTNAKNLFDKGIKTLLITSYLGQECASDEIAMVLLTASEAWLIKTPRLEFTIPPNGSGDLVSALLLDKILNGLTPKVALEQLATQMFHLFKATKTAGEREIQLIQEQEILTDKQRAFYAEKV